MITTTKIKEIYDAAMEDEKILNDLIENPDGLKTKFNLENSDIDDIKTVLSKTSTNKDFLKYIRDHHEHGIILDWFPVPEQFYQ